MLKDTVVIICSWYNRAEYIEQTVDSLLDQSFGDCSVLIVNDGSTDLNVKRKLDAYDNKKLTVVHQENAGLSKNLKKYIELVTAEYICVMGAGDTAARDKIKLQYDYMEEHPSVVALGCGHNLVSASTKKVIKYKAPVKCVTEECLKKHVPFTHGTVMYRASALKQVGSYDPFFKYCQDWDLYGRLIKNGRVCAIDQALYNKYIFSDGFTVSPEHNISQVFFSTLAKSQDRIKIEKFKNDKKLLDKHLNHLSPVHMPLVLKRVVRFSLMKEWGIARSWLKLFKQQVLNIFK